MLGIGLGLALGMGLGLALAMGLGLALAMGLGLALAMGLGLALGIGLGLMLACGLGLGLGVTLGIGLGLTLGTGLALGLRRGLGLALGIGLALGLGIGLGLTLGRGLGLALGIGLGEGQFGYSQNGVAVGFGLAVGVAAGVALRVGPPWLNTWACNAAFFCELGFNGDCSNGELQLTMHAGNGADSADCDISSTSPLILDLDGAGIIKLSGPESSGVTFDLVGDGAKLKHGWVTSPRQAFLALDLNHNGIIDNGRELFGNFTLLPNGRSAANGFEALAQYDTNHDGFITAKDPIFSQLVLWEDRNLNSITDPGELVPLAQEGIVSIDLHYVKMFEMDAYGNQTLQRSTFRRERRLGNPFSLIFDIWFAIEK